MPLRGLCDAFNPLMFPAPRLRFLTVLAVGLLGAASLPADVPLAEKSFPELEEILVGAARQSPRMLSRTLDLEIAEAGRVAARAGLLPSLSASYRHYQAQDDRADQSAKLSATKVYYDVTLTQPVFHWGERRNNARIGEIQKELAQGGYREAYRGLAQDLRQRYLSLIVQKIQLARARVASELAAEGVKRGEEQLAQRVITASDLQSLRIGAEQAQITLERTEFDYAAAKASFARLAGLPEFTDAQIPADMPQFAHDQAAIDRLVADFLSDPAPATPEAANLRRQRQIEELGLANHRTRLKPKVNAVAGVTQDEQSYTLNTADRFRVLSLYGGFAVNWTIFDGYAARSATRTSLARLRQLELEAEETLQRLRQQAQWQAKHVGFAARYMAMADHALASTEGSLRAKEEDLKRGTAAEADVAVGRIQLMDSRAAAFNARIDYLGRVAELLGTIARDPVTEKAEISR